MVAQSGKKGLLKKLSIFFKGVKAEMKKVNWPNKKELTNYTTVVLVTCALVAIIVGVFDFALRELFSLILG